MYNHKCKIITSGVNFEYGAGGCSDKRVGVGRVSVEPRGFSYEQCNCG